MRLVQHDYVIQQLPAEGADEPLDVPVLPRGAPRDGDLVQAKPGGPLPKRSAVDPVPIPDGWNRRIRDGDRRTLELRDGPTGRCL